LEVWRTLWGKTGIDASTIIRCTGYVPATMATQTPVIFMTYAYSNSHDVSAVQTSQNHKLFVTSVTIR